MKQFLLFLTTLLAIQQYVLADVQNATCDSFSFSGAYDPTPEELRDYCLTCWDKQTANGCEDPKFCSQVTGIPWCGGPSLGCDVGTDQVSSRRCCEKYVDHSIADMCGGLACPNFRAGPSNSSPEQLKEQCNQCFELSASLNCTAPNPERGWAGQGFCSSTTFGQVPWCGSGSQPEYCEGTYVLKQKDCNSF